MNELPRGFVPLPLIGEYTDTLSVHNLGFPVGFDEERLGVNLRGIERFAGCASIGAVEIYGASGQASDISINPVGNNFGVATAAGRVSATQQRLASGKISGRGYHPTAIVKINTSEVAEQIRSDGKFRRGQFDPAAQAKYLDKGIKEGLGEAAKAHLINPREIPYMAGLYALCGTMNASIAHDGPLTNVTSLAVVGGCVSLSIRVFPMVKDAERRPISLALRSTVAFDRLALARASLHTGSLIKQI